MIRHAGIVFPFSCAVLLFVCMTKNHFQYAAHSDNKVVLDV